LAPVRKPWILDDLQWAPPEKHANGVQKNQPGLLKLAARFLSETSYFTRINGCTWNALAGRSWIA